MIIRDTKVSVTGLELALSEKAMAFKGKVTQVIGDVVTIAVAAAVRGAVKPAVGDDVYVTTDAADAAALATEMAAIRRATSLLSSLAATRPSGSSS